MKKVWITGARGHVGAALLKALDTTRYQLLTTDMGDVDVSNSEDVHFFAQMNRPDVIINCAGMTDIAYCASHRDEAYRVNAIGPRNLAIEAEANNCKLIQISTGDLFNKPSRVPYTEFDPVHPVSTYGRSKYAGEQLLTGLTTRYVIIRTTWVYGTGRDFVRTVVEASRSREPLQTPINQYASPTSAKELAKVIAKFIDNDLFGTYHAVCPGACNYYEYAREIIKNLKLKVELVPVAEHNGVTPFYSVLDNMMLKLDGIEQPVDWNTALLEYLDE
ncbi:MAG: NAD(P)-dependent oxidoreductase [Clostridiales bacterium]|nr:NAD(P)-dependent oxidoreductase [Clostridiales bacterium]